MLPLLKTSFTFRGKVGLLVGGVSMDQKAWPRRNSGKYIGGTIVAEEGLAWFAGGFPSGPVMIICPHPNLTPIHDCLLQQKCPGYIEASWASHFWGRQSARHFRGRDIFCHGYLRSRIFDIDGYTSSPGSRCVDHNLRRPSGMPIEWLDITIVACPLLAEHARCLLLDKNAVLLAGVIRNDKRVVQRDLCMSQSLAILPWCFWMYRRLIVPTLPPIGLTWTAFWPLIIIFYQLIFWAFLQMKELSRCKSFFSLNTWRTCIRVTFTYLFVRGAYAWNMKVHYMKIQTSSTG